MPTKNMTIDNINPLIDYSPKGAWSEGNISDNYFPNYSNGGTFTLSVYTGANATFSFNGTAIWLFGAKRANHGLYNITLDGQTTTMNGYSPGTGIYQTPLFTQTHLTNTLHTITLTNAGLNSTYPFSNFLDLDYITWESTYGIGSKQVKETTLQDSDSSFSYQPQGSWNTSPEFLSFFFGQSGHATTTAEASMTLTFSGDTVQIFGTVGPKDAPYSVQLDNGSPLTFNATKYKAYQQVLLYYADNLGPGSHNVKITNKPALPGESLNINYALVDITLSLG
ncbi:hypothetical protein PILCRDRAFT_13409 [Piloderma croceum F 1598]|uniref:Uncharacterized protein n=1 Tax=Piloderma croceum (strain F 1598) TaxID=765440 RepID=A0A0C3F6U3_PILCF|nr:hypothetical protein PILCRDRAFT_13409 [Piloderma croceum F 1598]